VEVVVEDERRRTVLPRGQFRQDTEVETAFPHRAGNREAFHPDQFLSGIRGNMPRPARGPSIEHRTWPGLCTGLAPAWLAGANPAARPSQAGWATVAADTEGAPVTDPVRLAVVYYSATGTVAE